MLSTTYAAIDNENEYDKSHKIMFNKLVDEYIPKNDTVSFLTNEIIKVIKKLKLVPQNS